MCANEPAITALALAHERRAIVLAREQGRHALPALLALCQAGDAQVREIAWQGLDEVLGPDEGQSFCAALDDTDAMVRAVALRALQRRHAGLNAGALLDERARLADPLVRHHLALLLVGLATSAQLPALQQYWQMEDDAHAREGLLVAMASLGDFDARQCLLALLDMARGRERARLLGHAQLLHASWLLPALADMLDDETPGLRIGVDGLPGPEYLRCCDLALNLIAAQLPGSLPFAGTHLNYVSGQLALARDLVRSTFSCEGSVHD